jgi:hypothetical protein
MTFDGFVALLARVAVEGDLSGEWSLKPNLEFPSERPRHFDLSFGIRMDRISHISTSLMYVEKNVILSCLFYVWLFGCITFGKSSSLLRPICAIVHQRKRGMIDYRQHSRHMIETLHCVGNSVHWRPYKTPCRHQIKIKL